MGQVLHFAKGVHIVKDNLFPIPPLFRIIHEESGTDWKEMYKVFNMGHRMEIYIAPEHADEVMAISKRYGVDAQVVGRVEETDAVDAHLTLTSPYGTFEYDSA